VAEPGASDAAPRARRVPDGIVLRVVSGTDPVMRQVADLCYETLHRPFGVSRNDAWNETDPSSTHFVAMDGERLVGYTRLLVEGTSGHVRQVAVAPAYRCRGVASALVDAAVEHARREHKAFAVLNAREHAVALYERAGFRVTAGPFRMGRTYLRHVRMEMPLR
jgi:ribosomal protein S18 acetylase RimI-like enzyme